MELKEYFDSYKKYKLKDNDNVQLMNFLPKILTLVGKGCKPYEVEDLSQELICKLYENKQNWNPKKGKFNTYAYRLIKSNFPYYRLKLRTPVSMVGASPYVYEKLKKMYFKLNTEEFNNIQVEDLKVSIHLSPKTLDVIKGLVQANEDFSHPYNDSYDDRIENDCSTSLDERIDNQRKYSIISKLLKTLSPIEQSLINEYYFGEEQLSYTDIARRINKSPQYVYKKIKEGINKIKRMYDNKKSTQR